MLMKKSDNRPTSSQGYEGRNIYSGVHITKMGADLIVGALGLILFIFIMIAIFTAV